MTTITTTDGTVLRDCRWERVPGTWWWMERTHGLMIEVQPPVPFKRNARRYGRG